MMASMRGDADMVALLLQYGAQLDLRNDVSHRRAPSSHSDLKSTIFVAHFTKVEHM